jgi:hypothetical protein
MMNLYKKITPGEPLPSHSTMKKIFLETLNVPLSPLLLPPFHISRGKKNVNFHPPKPSTVQKIEGKKSTCTLLSSPPCTMKTP